MRFWSKSWEIGIFCPFLSCLEAVPGWRGRPKNSVSMPSSKWLLILFCELRMVQWLHRTYDHQTLAKIWGIWVNSAGHCTRLYLVSFRGNTISLGFKSMFQHVILPDFRCPSGHFRCFTSARDSTRSFSRLTSFKKLLWEPQRLKQQ